MSEKKTVEKVANVGGVDVKVHATINEVKNGISIKSFVPSDDVDAYFKAKGIDKNTRAKYEEAKNDLILAVREPMVQIFEENPTNIPCTTRIGNLGINVIMTPEKSVRSSVEKDAPMVPTFGRWKVTTKMSAPEFAASSDSSKEFAARIKAALKK